jgi:thiol:disulfide interchange protein DsbD
MGAPLLLIGTSAGRLLPRAGAWMNATKAIFGILLLAMAIYMISRFLPTTITMGLYGILALMSGVYLGATDTVSRESTGWQRFGRGASLVVGLYGLALLVGALAGSDSYMTPLRGVMSDSSGKITRGDQQGIIFTPVKGIDGLQQVVSEARGNSRPVMLDFYADWCVSCKEMEAFTFSDKRVQALLADVVLVQADVTANDAADQALLKQFDLFGPPGIIFYDTTGIELPAARVVGFLNAARFSDHLERFIGTDGSQKPAL